MGLAPYRVLDRLARLDEARETRPHPGLEAMRSAEQAALALDREHDGDRVGARKMLRLAGRTIAPPATLDCVGRRPAIRAESVARVPVQQRLAFRERRQMVGIDEAAHGDRAQIEDEEVVARLEWLDVFGIESHGESCGAVAEPKKDALRCAAKPARLDRREQRIVAARAFLQHHQFAADRVAAGALVCLAGREEARVGAPLCYTRDIACGIVPWLRPEIGTGRHEGTGVAGRDKSHARAP